VLDERARREIQQRVRELQREIDDADAAHDIGRAERARSAVTWRIRSAIKKIAPAHPRLGRHIENTVRTGTFCVYVPETPIEGTFIG
jgi:hypothetical protein